MKCNVCRSDVPQLDVQNKSHLLITKDSKDGHIHTHGDLAAKENCREMIEAAADEIGIVLASQEAKSLPKEIVFHNKQRIGDTLVFTCAVRDFKKAFPHVRVNVSSIAGHIWDHNVHIDRDLVPTPENTVKIGPKELTNASNRIDWHFSNAYRVSMEKALGIHIQQGESRPDIYFTQEEYDAPRIFDHPYWVICTSGEKGWGCKMYPQEAWQRVVDLCPEIMFVQIGTSEDNPPRLKGLNVIDYVGKTQSKENGIRDIFKLFLNAEGSIGLVSFHMHLSGALYKPAVIVAGAREPVRFTKYEGHQYLATDGCLPCATKACWHCAIDACTNLVIKNEEKIPKCVDMIEPAEVAAAIRRYYTGGRLQYGVASPKPKANSNAYPRVSVVPTPPPKPKALEIEPTPLKNDLNLYGMTFGGGALTDRDWSFITGVMDRFGVKTVLEFGAGLSTLLFKDYGVDLLTFETKQGWIDKIRSLNDNIDLQLWDGITLDYPKPIAVDMAFVDGPAGDIGREHSTRLAAHTAPIVIVHDAGREWARKYQDQYLKDTYNGPIKGGHRCHLWVSKTLTVPAQSIVRPEPIPQSKEGIVDREVQGCGSEPYPFIQNVNMKFVKIVSTARGWGGCARSVTTIMRLLLAAGHKVEFVPFRGAVTSSEYKTIMAGELNRVTVREDIDEALRERCDTLLVYADDYVWEFGKPEVAEAFAEVQADRKIMMLNYRRGKVGEIPWTRGWDKYIFLNSGQERELLKVHPGVSTRVLPPCTDLTPFFAIKPEYNHNLRIVRHNSQGDTKFCKFAGEEISSILLAREDALIKMLPGPSFVPVSSRFQKAMRTADPQVIADFLGTGNLFWYSLPEGYMDMGPRVILEAMAAGLPIMADNWGGAADRVTPETGWLVNDKAEYTKIAQNLSSVELRKKGEAARERAYKEFRPEAWLEELV